MRILASADIHGFWRVYDWLLAMVRDISPISPVESTNRDDGVREMDIRRLLKVL
jgi:hypothetical protein